MIKQLLKNDQIVMLVVAVISLLCILIIVCNPRVPEEGIIINKYVIYEYDMTIEVPGTIEALIPAKVRRRVPSTYYIDLYNIEYDTITTVPIPKEQYYLIEEGDWWGKVSNVSALGR
jgi:hypothetical protein